MLNAVNLPKEVGRFCMKGETLIHLDQILTSPTGVEGYEKRCKTTI